MTAHLVDEHGAYLCPEAEARDAMDDGAFWNHVLQPGEGRDYEGRALIHVTEDDSDGE